MRFALLTLSLLLGACATAPTEPTVLALPGTGKSLQQFNTDDLECRQGTRPRPEEGGSWTEQQRRYDFAYIQCMYAKGHRVPVPGQYIGAPAGGPPPPPTGNPPPPPPGKPGPAPQ